MTSKKKVSTDRKAHKSEPQGIVFDFANAYEIVEGTEKVPNIKSVSYSNLAIVQVSNRDIFIDFLEMPGMIEKVREWWMAREYTCPTRQLRNLRKSSKNCWKTPSKIRGLKTTPH